MRRITAAEAINRVAVAAALRAKEIPPLPHWRIVSGWFNQLNRSLEIGGGDFYLYCDGAGYPDAHWTLGCDPCDWPHADHSEHVPGDVKPGRFNPAGATRRLLAEARLAGFK